MKISLLLAVVTSALLVGCVVSSPTPVVAVQTAPEPVVYQPGYVVNTLPAGYRTTRYQRNVYYVNRGVYYRPQGHRYVVVSRPY